MKLAWKFNLLASALHACRAIAYSQMVNDSRVALALDVIAKDMRELLDVQFGLSIHNAWDDLISGAGIAASHHELATRVLGKSKDPSIASSLVLTLGGQLADLEAIYRLLFPKFNEQIPLRARPLIEFWDGYGQGLLAHLGRLTERNLLVDHADVMLLQPILAGAGIAHLRDNRVWIEAMLTNAIPELPEVIRLAWLVAQLHSRPTASPEVSYLSRLDAIAALAMLPPTLAAGQIVELTKIDEVNISLAIDQWQVPLPRDRDASIEVAPTLMNWWETYLQTRPAWQVAMAALDKMLVN